MDYSVQGDIRTPPDFGPLFSVIPLLLCVLAVGRTSCCKPRQAILCLRTCRLPTVEGAASIALVCRPLAGRAFSGLGLAPLAGPIGAKAPWNALLKVAICHAEISR